VVFVLSETLTVPGLLVNSVQADTLAHFLNFEHHKARLAAAITMVCPEEVDSLCLASVGEQPSGRLRDEPDRAHNDDAGEALHGQGDLPRQVALDLVAAKGDRGGGNGTTKPSAVVETYKVKSEASIVEACMRNTHQQHGHASAEARSQQRTISFASASAATRLILHLPGTLCSFCVCREGERAYCRGSNSHDGNAASKDEASNYDLGKTHRSCGKDGTKNDDAATEEHAIGYSVSPSVVF